MTTLNLVITANGDDAREIADGSTSTSSSSMISDDPGEYLGFRFTGVTVPNAATINTALLAVWVGSNAEDEPWHVINLEAHDNAPAISAGSNNFNLSGRTYTGSPVIWDNANLGVGGAPGGFVTAPDLSAPLQDVVDRAGWSSGNAVLISIWGNSPADSNRDLGVHFRDASSARAATFDIDYTEGGGGGTNRRRRVLM